MNSTAARVIGFLVTLALVATASYGVGRLLAPEQSTAETPATPVESKPTEQPGHGHGTDAPSPAAPSSDAGDDHGDSHEHGESADPEGESDAAPGTVASAKGYTLTLLTPTRRPGSSAVELIITGPDGRVATDYDVIHEKELHLIAVRDDLSGFNHVHPKRAKDGTWRTTLELTPGRWRVYADVQPAPLEEPVVLGASLTVTGDTATTELPTPARSVEVDGYTVTLDGATSDVREWAEGEQELRFTITRDGKPVTDLQPYLGAYAHVVAIRNHDLGYTHVHPMEGPAGPEIVAHVEFTSNGQYRAFVEFRHRDQLHRAEFTLDVP